jgi:L-serine deaminase
MSCGPIFIALVQGTPAALVTLIIGLIALQVALRQASVAEAKLKLDLFEKRYPIFQETWEIMSEVVMKGTRHKHYGLSNPFANFRPRARFLFGQEVEAYLSEAAKKWVDLHAYEAECSDPNSAAQNAAKAAELTNWFSEQASTGLKDLFAPYLEFKNLR